MKAGIAPGVENMGFHTPQHHRLLICVQGVEV
jgi:hypothetical protein